MKKIIKETFIQERFRDLSLLVNLSDKTWITVCNICGGAVGVVSGGYITDKLQTKFGLHSRYQYQNQIMHKYCTKYYS